MRRQGGQLFGRTPPRAFFRRSAVALAPDLLGLVLYHETPEGMVAGRIVEVEAYCGPQDLAAHSARGRRTARNEVMYGEAGFAYVYFVYGMHHCFNVVAAAAEVPEAVLLRAVEPILGLDLMQARRGAVAPADLARGPGNLTRAFAIGRESNGADLRSSGLRIVLPGCRDRGRAVGTCDVVRSPRVGVDYAGAWAARPWRFSLRGSPYVSRPPQRAGALRPQCSARAAALSVASQVK